MAVETWDFGVLATLVEVAHRLDRAAISAKYGVPTAKIMSSWLRTLGYVRNICAHHGRLWNHPLVIQPMIPSAGLIPKLDHLTVYVPTQTRVYAAAAIAQHLLGVIAPTSAWKDRLKGLWNDFPAIPGILSGQAGFMASWRTWPLWQ
jgi:abortive infection bacteriophage resistance protein